MKRRTGILLSVILLLLVLTVAVACDPKEEPKAQRYEIAFESNGGDAVESIVAEAGADISELLPDDPTKSDLFFGGWSLENNGFGSEVVELPTTMPAENVKYFARWTRHAVIVPMLQPLDENGEPDTDKENYSPSENDSLTVEVDPADPELDLYENRPEVKGFHDASTPEEHNMTVDVKEKKAYLYYNRSGYNISYNLNNTDVVGSITAIRRYFGQKLELPNLPLTIEVPYEQRFAGWSSDFDGEKDFEPFGKEIEIGVEGSIIDGSVSNVTLYAVYDDGYIDFSEGDDCVFIPKHEEGVVYVRRAGMFDFKGEYFKNTAISEESPHIGEFVVTMDAGTTLDGYIYEDGYFAYKQNFSDDFVFLTGQDIPCYSQEDNSPVEGSFIKLVDLYGCASLTITQSITKQFFISQNGQLALVSYTLDAGTYIGGYWYDTSLEDYCFSILITVDGVEVQFDLHFQFVQYPQTPDEIYFTFAGKEMGMFCEGLSSSGIMLGDLILLDGYGSAIAVVGNSQYQGDYYQVSGLDGEPTGAYITSMQDAAGNYLSLLMRPDFSDVYGENAAGLLVMSYEKGDSALLALCQNKDGDIFYSDGFGNAVYTTKNGEISGNAALVGDVFENTTPAVVYKLTESGGKPHWFIVDQSGTTGDFVHTEKEVELNYLYDTSEAADEYVGAIATAGSEAYFLTAVTTSAGNVIFREINEGTVTSDAGGGYIFKSNEKGYIISYAKDEALTNKFDISTISTAQMKLDEITFDVYNAGNELGTLEVTADGKATYNTSAEGGFEDAAYEYAYGSVIVRQGESIKLFIAENFGSAPKAFATVEKKLYVADSEDPTGILYEYEDGGKKYASLWLDMYGEMHFYAIAEIVKASDATTRPLSNEYVYLIDTSLSSYYAIRTASDDYLAPNRTLVGGEFTIYEDGKAGTDKLQLDAYGFAKYTQAGTTYEGSYGIVDGVYKVTFNEAEGAPEAFKFVLSGYNFQKVDYSEFYVVNPATLAVISVLRIYSVTDGNISGKTADLFRASEDSDGNVSMGTTSLGSCTITDDGNGIYTFSDTTNNITFTFRFDEYIFTQKVLVRNNVSLPKDTFTEEGVNEDVSKKVTLDEYGRATYFDGTDEHVGFYYNDGGMFRFIDPQDKELDLLFTLDRDIKRLIIYGAEAKPFDGGIYDIEYNETAYQLRITVDGEELQATLLSGSTPVVTSKLNVDEDNIFSFSATDASGKSYDLKFIISKGALVMYDSEWDYENIGILMGNLEMFKRGIEEISNNLTYDVAGMLTVKGFKEVAEIYNGEYIKGRIEIENGNLIFTDEQGNTQEFYILTDGENKMIGLFIYGSEKGAAVTYYYTMGAVSLVPEMYFDGLGGAFAVDPRSSAQTSTKIGEYFIGANPYDRTGNDQNQYIIVGNFANEGGSTVFDLSHVYAPYLLHATNDDGSARNITGVVEYNEKHDAIVTADDGSVFVFDGFDVVTYVDSLGVAHSGYFNNYGEMMTGIPDNRYIITDEYDDAVIYFIDFVDKQIDADGNLDMTPVNARRASYIVYTPYTNLYAEVQFMYEDDYKAVTGYDDVPEGKQGYATLILLVDGTQQIYYGGFFTIEGGLMIIEVTLEDGTTEEIVLALNIDGSANWSNYRDWLSDGEE